MRLIDADALKKIIEDIENDTADEDENSGRDGTTRIISPVYIASCEAIDIIADCPTVDPVRHGRWVPARYKPETYLRCSLCDRRTTYDDQSDYCPSCGAKMDKENKT